MNPRRLQALIDEGSLVQVRTIPLFLATTRDISKTDSDMWLLMLDAVTASTPDAPICIGASRPGEEPKHMCRDDKIRSFNFHCGVCRAGNTHAVGHCCNMF